MDSEWRGKECMVNSKASHHWYNRTILPIIYDSMSAVWATIKRQMCQYQDGSRHIYCTLFADQINVQPICIDVQPSTRTPKYILWNLSMQYGPDM
jgi:hypothetical protein